jgi:ATP-dependent Clp protease ATP-binding subunit ClpA
MFERFTRDARAVVEGALERAHWLGSDTVDVPHLLLAVLAAGEGPGGALTSAGVDEARLEALASGDVLDEGALAAIGIDLDAVRREADRVFGEGALDRAARRPRRGHLPFTAAAKKSLELALREAIHLGDRSITADHLVLGLARPATEGADVLRRVGADPEAVRAAILGRRAGAA